MTMAQRYRSEGREPTRIWGMGETCGTQEQERRVMCQSLALWESARVGDEPAPVLEAIDLTDAMLAPYFYVVAVASEEQAFATSRVAHCGGALSRLCGREAVGHNLWDLLPHPIREETIDYLHTAQRLGKPMAESGSYLRGNGDEVLFRGAIMPLRPDRGRQHLLGALSFCHIPASTPESDRLTRLHDPCGCPD